MKLLTAVSLLPLILLAEFAYSQEAAEVDIMTLTRQCRGCHGDQGKTVMFPDYPVIGYSSPEYIFSALKAYKTGGRKVSGMGMMMPMSVAPLSEDQLWEISVFFGTPNRIWDMDQWVAKNKESLKGVSKREGRGKKIMIYGATGGQGNSVVMEALYRGYDVVGLSRGGASRFSIDHPKFTGDKGEFTDADSMRDLIARHQPDVIVSTAATAPSNFNMMQRLEPEDTVQAIGAKLMVEVLSEIDEEEAPRFIQVGGATTLYYEGHHALEHFAANPQIAGAMPPKGTAPYGMFEGNNLSLKALMDSEGVKWTNATPALTYDYGPRTGEFKWVADDSMVFDEVTGLHRISRADLAVAILDEIKNEDFVKDRFNVHY